MRKKDLIALIPGPEITTCPADLSVHYSAGWNVILASARGGRRPGRRAMLRRAQVRQTWLEALMPRGTVLPALPGTRLSPADIPAMLAANAVLLTDTAAQLANRVQFQITIRCDPDAAMAAMATQAGPFAGLTDPDRWQTVFARQVEAHLDNLPDAALLALPRTGDVALNTTLLLPADQQIALDAVIEEIDSWWSSGLAIRLIGPSPAVSFASLGLTPVPLKAIEAAARLLGLPGRATPEAIRAARQNALKQPGAVAETIRDAATLLQQAQALPAPARFLRAFVWSEGRATSSALGQTQAA